MDFYQGISQSNVDLFCGDYNEQSEICSKLTVSKSVKVNRYNYANILSLIIDILASIKDASSVPFG